MGSYGQGPPPPPMGSWQACHAASVVCCTAPGHWLRAWRTHAMLGLLARIFHTLHQLPALQDVAARAAPLQPGTWCATAVWYGDLNHL
jgi:hypothetical protein